MRAGPFLTMLLAGSVASSAEMVVVADGRAKAVVVTAKEPTALATYAASELVRHVEKATGVKLAVAGEGTVPGEPTGRIYVGPCEAAKQAGVVAAKLPREAFVLKTVGSALFIVGEDSDGDPLSMDTRAGTLWGVYELLEEALGARWLWPGELGTYVPTADRVVIPKLDRTVKPWLLQRQLRHGLRLRGDTSRGFSPEGLKQYAHDQAVFLRRHRMGRTLRLRYGHAFNAWWKRYGEEHPDWFQLLPNGKRGPSSSHARFSMCVANPGFHRQIVEEWKARKAKQPDEFININCCENDIRGLCTCERCVAWDGPQPETIPPRFGPRVVSDRYASFYLAVQQLAARHDPGATVVAYAYVNYAPPPSPSIRLNDHIYVGTVPDVFFPRTAEEQQWVLAQWDGWARTGARVFLRPNYFLGGYCMPHVFARQFADEFRHEAAHGMVFTDFDSLTGQWATQGTNLYVLVRLHTRPKRAADELLAEYYAAFGKAGPVVGAYFDYWERYATEHQALLRRVNWSRYASRAHELFPAEAFAHGDAILTQAAQAAAGDAGAAARVAFLKTGLDHARLAADVCAKVRTGHPTAARRAIARLMQFRRDHERKNFSNLHFCSFIEGRSWQIPEAYGGEPLRAVADTVGPLKGTPAMPTRGRHVFVALLRKGERLRARIACRRIGTSEHPADWRVFGPDDQPAARGSVGVGEDGEVDALAEVAGVHVLVLDTGRSRGQVTLLSEHSALTGRRIHFIGRASTLHFWVPEGTVRFAVTMGTPAPGETATLIVRAPNGQPVAEATTGAKEEVVAEVKVAEGQAGRAWSVTVERGGPGVFEDYVLTLDRSLPAYWSHAADRLVIPTIQKSR